MVAQAMEAQKGSLRPADWKSFKLVYFWGVNQNGVKVAVVILNWNGQKFLEKFLPGILRFTPSFATVIVADNASSDGSIEFLSDNYPQIRTIIFDRNYGFAEGYNRAFMQIEAEYYVLLNSDMEVTENWISPVIELMDNDPRIAACQPKIRSYHEPEKFEYAGAAGGYIDKFGYPFCRGRIFQQLEVDHGQYDNAVEVFWATGACMFVRSRIYHEVGGLDNDFFAHMEEIDFCWRLKNRGYRIMICPRSTVYHIGGGTLPKNNAQKTYLNIRNNIIMLYKNLETKWLLPVFAARALLDLLAAVKFLMDGGFNDLWAVIRAHFYFWTHFHYLRKKRENIPHRLVSCIYAGNIVLDHYVKRRNKFTDLKAGKFTSETSKDS